MDKQYFYRFYHQGEEYFEAVDVVFPIRLTEEQRNYLQDRSKNIGDDPVYEVCCLSEAVGYALEEFYEKYHIQGTLNESPFEWIFEI